MKDDQVYSILYNAQDMKIHNKDNLQSNELEVADLLDDVRWCPTKTDIQKKWEAAVSSISLEIASFDPRPRVVELPEKPKQKQVYYSSDKTWRNIQSPFESDDLILPPPEELSAFEARSWERGRQGVDMRPHLFEQNRQEMILVDSGSQVSTFPPEPGDTVDPNMSLRAVNGTKINCYGYKEVFIKINRKSYPIKVIKSDVKEPILGWDFIRRHRLSFEWNEWGDVCIIDRKSKIRTVMHFKPIPFSKQNASLRVSSSAPVNSEDSHSSLFELAAMRNLADTFSQTDPNILSDEIDQKEDYENDLSKMPESDYKNLIKRFPDILKLSFKEEHTKNGILHRILTGEN